MNLEQKANEKYRISMVNGDLVIDNGIECGLWVIEQIKMFCNANPRATVKQVLEHLNGMK